MSWTDNYIGLPYTEFGRTRENGCDCWGLAKVIYQEELGISLPDYLGYSSIEELAELAAVIAGAVISPLWVPVTGKAVAFDIAVFRRGRLDTHVGIVVRPGLMIHIARDDCAKIERYHVGAWSHRFTGAYRHVDLVCRAVK
ncbi:NlpC/P60 family protein [Neorhizobium petrolearium]|uniref:NlpC/P60 family protein n=1 Tax=Neorhizobium petrolearium TaxID=515361 RepID=UPI003F81AAB5